MSISATVSVTMGPTKRSADSIGAKGQSSSRRKRTKIDPDSAAPALPRPKGQVLEKPSAAAPLATHVFSIAPVPAASASAPASAPPSVPPEGLITFQQLSQMQKLSQFLVPFPASPLAVSEGAGSGAGVVSPLHLFMLPPPNYSLPVAMTKTPSTVMPLPLSLSIPPVPKVEEASEKAAAELSASRENEQANKFLEEALALLKKDNTPKVSAAVEPICRQGLSLATDPLIKAKLHRCLGEGMCRLGTRGALTVAIDNYQQALKLTFNDDALRSLILCDSGGCFIRRREGDDLNQAIIIFQEVLKLPFEQNYGSSYYNLGRCYLEHPKPLDDFLTTAIDCLRKALKYKSSNLFRSERFYQLALALEKRAQPGDLDEARQNLLQGLIIKHDHKGLEQESMTVLNHVQHKRGVFISGLSIPR